ncbi:hypothetical protein [Motilibacter deserti]|uniref:Uncharacterized protein n=1 Tax=Motilibacter deserti TaxID=2714956 RepID=A0ABX0GUN6_9ACTN|nr:hypothetical protein [Motilibacter deserti]NHC14614.1 hypothetical protein [Motilibacter deserti]
MTDPGGSESALFDLPPSRGYDPADAADAAYAQALDAAASLGAEPVPDAVPAALDLGATGLADEPDDELGTELDESEPMTAPEDDEDGDGLAGPAGVPYRAPEMAGPQEG